MPNDRPTLPLTDDERRRLATMARALKVAFGVIGDSLQSRDDLSAAFLYLEAREALSLFSEALNSAAERAVNDGPTLFDDAGEETDEA